MTSFGLTLTDWVEIKHLIDTEDLSLEEAIRTVLKARD